MAKLQPLPPSPQTILPTSATSTTNDAVKISIYTFIRVSSLFDNEWHHGTIEIVDNKVVDFQSKIEHRCALEVQHFPHTEFKKLVFQKSTNNFAHMPYYTDGLVSTEELKEYR